MGDGSLTFVMPVRDPQGVADWAGVRELIALTLNCLSAVPGNTHVVVVAQRGTDLPGLPSGARLVEVDLPYTPLPVPEGPIRHAAVRRDKGARIHAGLVAAQPSGHVMVVDYDDFVSRRLAQLVADHPNAPGWVVEDGYIYDGGPLVIKRSRFNRLCGTSLIVRADLLKIPANPGEADIDWVDRALGSHIFLRDDLADQGTPLSPTPFPGAVYRIGHGANTSGSPSLRRMFFPARRSLRQPRRAIRNFVSLRTTFRIREEFALP